MALLAEEIRRCCVLAREAERGQWLGLAWHGEGPAGTGWRGPAMVVTVSQGSWMLLHSQAQQGERVLMGHPAEMPQLALPKIT